MSRQLPVTNGGSVLGMASTDVTLASILKYAASNPGSFGQLEQSHSSSSLREDCCPPPSHEIEQAVAQHGSPCGRGGGRGGVSGGGGRSSAGPGAAASDGGAALEELEDEEEDEEEEEDEDEEEDYYDLCTQDEVNNILSNLGLSRIVLASLMVYMYIYISVCMRICV